jgi:hypothetical protein
MARTKEFDPDKAPKIAVRSWANQSGIRQYRPKHTKNN